MTSYIITGKDKNQRAEANMQLCNEHDIDPIDISRVEKETTIKPSTQSRASTGARQSIGIEEIKQIQKKIFFKAIKSKTKAVVIEDAHLLTTEAQNALLKVLEEPPQHTIIILSAEDKEAFLPTILSRCHIIALASEIKPLTEKAKNDITGFLKDLPTMPIGDRLKKAERLAKDKEKALVWTEHVILALREELMQTTSPHTAQQIRSFQSLHTTLKTTNVNLRFALETTLLIQ